MFGTDCSEVTAVQGNDDFGPHALGQRDDGGVRAPERKIGILIYKISDSRPILSHGRLDVEALKTPQEAGLG